MFPRDPHVPTAPHDSEEGRELISNGLCSLLLFISLLQLGSLSIQPEKTDGVEVNCSHSFKSSCI